MFITSNYMVYSQHIPYQYHTCCPIEEKRGLTASANIILISSLFRTWWFVANQVKIIVRLLGTYSKKQNAKSLFTFWVILDNVSHFPANTCISILTQRAGGFKWRHHGYILSARAARVSTAEIWDFRQTGWLFLLIKISQNEHRFQNWSVVL